MLKYNIFVLCIDIIHTVLLYEYFTCIYNFIYYTIFYLGHINRWIAPSRIANTSLGSLGGRLYPAAHIPDRHRCETEKSTPRCIVLDSEQSISNFITINI